MFDKSLELPQDQRAAEICRHWANDPEIENDEALIIRVIAASFEFGRHADIDLLTILAMRVTYKIGTLSQLANKNLPAKRKARIRELINQAEYIEQVLEDTAIARKAQSK
jgi:hypothetical protein